MEGARMSRIQKRDAGQLYYRVRADGKIYELNVHVFDGRGLSSVGGVQTYRKGVPLWVKSRNGINTVTLLHPRGFVYVFTSSMEQARLIELVSSSNLFP